MDDENVNPGEAGKEHFDRFSAEYAQALEALGALKAQAGTLLLMGNQSEFSGFIDTFVEMARNTAGEAELLGVAHFADWFNELASEAEKLRGQTITEN